VAAVAFLTRVPVGRSAALGERDIARGAVFFPLVGAAIGAVTGLVVVGLADVLPPLLAAGIGVAFEAALTGAIHLDALADFADGLGGSSKEHALTIMRDPRIGSFGVTALVLDLVLRAGALAALVGETGLVAALAASFALGRAAPLILGAALPYARPEGGSGRLFTEGLGNRLRAIGVVSALVLAVAFVGLRGLTLGGATALAILLVGVVAWRRLGGVTGDVLGAGIELATTGALLAAAATV
jgi:adenosylcobinamide-GDP ribazoletransferase